MNRNAYAAQSVQVTAGDAQLDGDLALPDGAQSVVAFAHGSGSGRRSPRNRQVAAALNEAGFGTLLFDLLTPQEALIDERTTELRFDIALLGRRMTGAVDWLRAAPETRSLALGLFGASTGAAAALIAAANRPDAVAAVVSRGGRPDLASATLGRVQTPVLLIVGGNDPEVIELNRRAQAALPYGTAFQVVSGATHLFEEPGALEAVVQLAADWFGRHLRGDSRAAATGETQRGKESE